jgi:hypothetical protein
MEAQKPAKGIMEQTGGKDWKFYRVPCSCGCDNQIDLMVEVDDYNVSANFYAETKTAWWKRRFDTDGDDNWLVYVVKEFINDWINRFSVAWTALTKGYVKTEVTVMLSDQQCINFAETLKTAVADLQKLRDPKNESD